MELYTIRLPERVRRKTFFCLDGRRRPDGATPEQLAALPADRRAPDVNIFEAFEQQAGLRLEARREPVEVLVIDHIEQADAN